MNRLLRSLILVSAFEMMILLPSRAQQPTEGWSNGGTWKYEVRENKDEEKEIWIVPEKNPSGARLLTATGGWGNLRIHVSPDDRVIVVEDGGASLGIDLRVFRAPAGSIAFAEDDALKIGDLVEVWAVKKAGGPTGSILGHRYIRAHGWGSKGNKLLVSISGREGDLVVPGWYAICDLESGDLSFDLEELNRRG